MIQHSNTRGEAMSFYNVSTRNGTEQLWYINSDAAARQRQMLQETQESNDQPPHSQLEDVDDSEDFPCSDEEGSVEDCDYDEDEDEESTEDEPNVSEDRNQVLDALEAWKNMATLSANIGRSVLRRKIEMARRKRTDLLVESRGFTHVDNSAGYKRRRVEFEATSGATSASQAAVSLETNDMMEIHRMMSLMEQLQSIQKVFAATLERMTVESVEVQAANAKCQCQVSPNKRRRCHPNVATE